MRITLYRSNLCPRCLLARKHLYSIIGEDPAVFIEEIDILGSPKRCRQDGIGMVPAIVIGKEKLSGIFLSRKAIRAFINLHKT